MSQRQGEAAALGNIGLVYSANGELDPAARQCFTEALRIMNHKREANLRSLVNEAAAPIQTLTRCDPSAALGIGLVKVPRDELVMVLGHSTEQAECQPGRPPVDTHTHAWWTMRSEQ